VQTALQSSALASRTSTVAPLSQPPETTTTAAANTSPSIGVVTAGAAGASVSRTKATSAESGLMLNAASIWRAMKTWAPSASAIGLQVKAPLAQYPEQIPVEPSNTATVAPVSQAPTTAAVASLMTEPGAGRVIDGASGASVSTTNGSGTESAPRLPAR